MVDGEKEPEAEPEKTEPEAEVKEEDAPSSLLEETKATVKKLEEQNKVLKENLDRAEKIESDSLLGGRSNAGTQAPKEVEISDKEYAQKALRGELP